jgi:hypothetical protein
LCAFFICVKHTRRENPSKTRQFAGYGKFQFDREMVAPAARLSSKCRYAASPFQTVVGRGITNEVVLPVNQ